MNVRNESNPNSPQKLSLYTPINVIGDIHNGPSVSYHLIKKLILT